MERYFEINEIGHNIRCKLYCSNPAAIQKVILYCHGFAGHKDTRAAAKFADRVLTKYKKIAVLAFDWPCHGDDVKKKLQLKDCDAYVRLITEYIKKQYATEDIYAYATSFGGYLILKYISENGNPFRKIALRCPAVDMYGTLTKSIITPEAREKMDKGKNALVGFDRKIEVSPQFLSELQEADITGRDFLPYADDIIIIHGSKDELLSGEGLRRFADDNVIEFILIQNADHRFQDPNTMEAATKAVLGFFEL